MNPKVERICWGILLITAIVVIFIQRNRQTPTTTPKSALEVKLEAAEKKILTQNEIIQKLRSDTTVRSRVQQDSLFSAYLDRLGY